MNVPSLELKSDSELGLPDYAVQLDLFHQAFASELRDIVASLPVEQYMHVVDVGCGDGFFTQLIADRLSSPGRVIGLDNNRAFLKLAQRRETKATCVMDFIRGEVSDLVQLVPPCDLVWCAQSLYSLPEPIAALKQMAQVLRPGGLIIVLENDTLHQVLLPWPSDLEIALRVAEFRALQEETAHPGKYYVGRRLPALFAAAGLEPMGFRTQCIDRSEPISDALESFLRLYLTQLFHRVEPYLDSKAVKAFTLLIDHDSSDYLPRQAYFTMSWINVVACGRRPFDASKGCDSVDET